MDQSGISGRIVRFGPFEADLEGGDLRKNGLSLKVRGQPFGVLAMLLETPGRVVSRDDLRKRLWPEETFVDFDHSLNTAINKLREGLGDSADNPRFVETLPRRGYRFIAPVEALTAGPSPDGRGEPEPVSISQPSPLGRAWPRDAGAGEGARTKWRWILAAAVAGAAVIMAALVGYLLTRPLPLPKVVGSVQITRDGQAKYPPVLTDGSRLFYMAGVARGVALYQVSIAGGEAVAISTPFSYFVDLESISPDGSELLVQVYEGNPQGNHLSIFPSLAGPSHRLGSVLSDDAAWSPDGKKLVYVSGQDLYVARRDGTESRKLVTVPGVPRGIQWSPDQKVLRFTLYEPKAASRSLWEVTADGTNLHALLPGWNNPAAECCGRWTPDGRYFVFQSTRSGRADIWAIGEKESLFQKPRRQPVQLTTGPLDFSGPVPSKDGKRLFVIGSQPRGELARYDTKSGEFVRYLSGISADQLNFSRDGKWVVYVTEPDHDLWRSKADGSEKLQLTFPPMHPNVPHWSPDGRQIVFTVDKSDWSEKLYVISADGGTPEELPTGEDHAYARGWSRDGDSIVFIAAPGATTSIKLFDLKSKQTSRVPGSEDSNCMALSPDGRYLTAGGEDRKGLRLFDLGTRTWSELAGIKVASQKWSADGKYVYLDGGSAGESAIFRIRIADRKLERVLSSKEFRRYRSDSACHRFALAPDGSPILTRDIGIREIYALDWEAP